MFVVSAMFPQPATKTGGPAPETPQVPGTLTGFVVAFKTPTKTRLGTAVLKANQLQMVYPNGRGGFQTTRLPPAALPRFMTRFADTQFADTQFADTKFIGGHGVQEERVSCQFVTCAFVTCAFHDIMIP